MSDGGILTADSVQVRARHSVSSNHFEPDTAGRDGTGRWLASRRPIEAHQAIIHWHHSHVESRMP
jgi:hypothetical protein